MSYPPYPPTPPNPFPGKLPDANWAILYDASLGYNPPLNATLSAQLALQESSGGTNPITLTQGNPDSNGTTSYGMMQINSGSGMIGKTVLVPTDADGTYDLNGTQMTSVVLDTSNIMNPIVNAYASAALQNVATVKANSIDGGSAALIATLYNSPNATQVSDYGRKVVSQGGGAPTTSAQSQGTPTGTSANFNRSIVAATGLPPVSASADDVAALIPKLYIEAGLDVTPWYKDPNLLTGNPRVSKTKAPVVFKVMLKRDGSQWLPVNPSANPTNQIPLEIRLNASMKEFNITSKHNFHQQQTRTGWHLTMWGMQADTIEGQCTTGVFMNQMGLTDFYSTSTVSDTLQQLLMSGYRFRSAPNGQVITTYAPAGMGGAPAAGPVQPGAASPTTPSDYTMLMQNERVPDISEAMRVAAQDAFVEFLSLFKMNGNVWYHNDRYQNTGQDLTQAGTSLYSSTTGISNTQMNARNNDILTRGYVTMRYKSNTYYGFFKSLSWQMSAEKPFQWTFSFVFQVERTINQLYLPR
jgi:hypothetical protein